MNLKHFATLAAALVLSFAPAPAFSADVEPLGQPCRAFNILYGRNVKAPDGRDYLVLANMNEATHTELIFLDYDKNEARTFVAPAGSGAWSLNQVPNDRLVVGTYYDGTWMTFDLKSMAFTKTAKIKGEDYIWSSALGSDGRLYGGTYPGAHLAALNLDTHEIEDFGNPVPPNTYLRNVSALPDGRLLCQFGMVQPARMIFDPKTKEFAPVPKQLAGVDTAVCFQGYLLSGNSWDDKQGGKGSRIYKGDSLELVETPPFPTPPSDKGAWTADVYASTNDALLYRQGNTVWRLRAGTTELEKVYEGDLKSRIMAQTPDGKLLLVRGQDYAVVSPGDTDVKLLPIPAEKGPRLTHFLRAAPDGVVWGGPTFGQTVFHLDPRTRQYTNTGTVCDGGGEVYDATFLNGKTYLVAYSGGDIIEYDPAQPWDQWHNKNPRTIAHLSSKGYIRPVGGVLVGPDNKLYSGWMAKYGTYGGAVAITDPRTGDTELVENPFGNQAVSAVAVDDKRIYVGTSLGANGLPNQKGKPTFGVLDLTTRQPLFQQSFDGASGIEHVLYDAATTRAVASIGRKLQIFDPAQEKFLPDLTKEAPDLTSHSLAGRGDGKAYYANGPKLLRLDLATGTAEEVATLPEKIDTVAISKDNTLFASCGPTVYRIK
jgi:hypothetical protein